MPVFRFRFLLVLLAGGFFAHPAASDTAAIIPIHLLIVFHTSLVLPEIVKNRRLVSCCMSCCIFLKKGFFCETFSRGKKESFPKTGKKNRINTDFFSIHAVLTIGPPGGIRTPQKKRKNAGFITFFDFCVAFRVAYCQKIHLRDLLLCLLHRKRCTDRHGATPIPTTILPVP